MSDKGTQGSESVGSASMDTGSDGTSTTPDDPADDTSAPGAADATTPDRPGSGETQDGSATPVDDPPGAATATGAPDVPDGGTNLPCGVVSTTATAARGDTPGSDAPDAGGSTSATISEEGGSTTTQASDPDATVTVPREPGGAGRTPDPDATVTGATAPGPDVTVTGPEHPDPDRTVTVTRPTHDPDATVSVPAGSIPEPTWVGPAPAEERHGAAWPPGTWGPPGQVPPPGGPGATAWWPGTPEPIRRRNGKPLAVLGVVLLLAVVAGVVFLVLPPGATTAVRNAADAARGWTGVTYRGTVRGPAGSPVTVDLTVGPNGDKSGTLTRTGGGRAEFAESGGVQALRGNAAWWTGAPQGTDKGRRLAGSWLRSPTPETTWLAPLPLLSPTALADDLAPANGPDYEDTGDQQVDDVAGRVVAAPDKRVVLADDRDARLLSVVPAQASDPVGLRVGAAAPDQVAAIEDARSAVASAQDYSAVLYDPVDVAPEVLPGPPCGTPTCVVTTRLTNTGGLEARGVVAITADGKPLNRFPFTIAPKGVANFTSTIPNPAYVQNVARATTFVEATVLRR